MTSIRCVILSESADDVRLSAFVSETPASTTTPSPAPFPPLPSIVRATVEYLSPLSGPARSTATIGRTIPLGFVRKDGTLLGGGLLAIALGDIAWWSMFQLDSRYRSQSLAAPSLAELIKFAGSLTPRLRTIRASISCTLHPRIVHTYTTAGFVSTGRPHPDVPTETVYELHLPDKAPVKKGRKKVVKKTRKVTSSPTTTSAVAARPPAPTIVEPATGSRDSTIANQPPLPPTPRLASPDLPVTPASLPSATVGSDIEGRRASSRTSLPPIQRAVSNDMASSDSESSIGSSPAPTPVPTPEPVTKVTVASRLIESEADLDAHLARLRANVTALMAVRGAVLWSPTQLRAVEQFDIDTVETLDSAMSTLSKSDAGGESPRAATTPANDAADDAAAQQAENDAVLWGDNEKPDNAKQLTKSQVDDIVNWNKKTRTSTLHDMTSIKPDEALGQLAWEMLDAELDALRREEADASDSDESDSDDSDSITDAAELDLLHLSLGGRLTPRLSRNRDANPATAGSRIGRGQSGLATSSAGAATGDDESPESSDRGSPSMGSTISGRGRNVSVINAGDFRRVTDDAILQGIARLKPVANATVADRSAPLIEPGTTVKTFDKSAHLTSIAVGKTKLKHVQEDAVHDASAPKLPSVVVPSSEDVHRMTEEVVSFFIDGGGLNKLRPVRAVSDRSAPVLEVEVTAASITLAEGQPAAAAGQRS